MFGVGWIGEDGARDAQGATLLIRRGGWAGQERRRQPQQGFGLIRARWSSLRRSPQYPPLQLQGVRASSSQALGALAVATWPAHRSAAEQNKGDTGRHVAEAPWAGRAGGLLACRQWRRIGERGGLTLRNSSNTESSTPLSSKSTRELLITSSMMDW